MPRVSRKLKRRREGYTQWHIEQLLQGFTTHCNGGFGALHKGLGDIPAMQKAWEELKHELLPDWIRQYPGTRPYAWWKFDAKEPRQRTDGVQHPFQDRVRKARVQASSSPKFRGMAYELFYGCPRALITQEDFKAQYESELQYLDRLGLLTDEERKEIYG